MAFEFPILIIKRFFALYSKLSSADNWPHAYPRFPGAAHATNSMEAQIKTFPRNWRVLLTVLAAIPTISMAQTPWPTRPITLIVPFTAGGGTDSIARDIARNMSDQLGQPVIIDNRGGAGGAIGANAVAKAAADGYTRLFATSTFATNAAIEPKLPFDPLKDFAPIAMIGRGPLLVVASKGLGVKNVDQLIAAVKSKPDGLNYCSAGNGSINHLSGEMFRQKTGLNMTHGRR